MPAAIIEAGCLTVFLFVVSGWGSLLPDRWWGPSGWRAACAGYVVGWGVFAAFYTLAAQLAAPFSVAVGGSALLLVAGALGLVRAGRRTAHSLLARIAVALAIAVYWIAGSNIAGNPGAIDHWYYVASPFLLFKPDWITANVVGLADGSAVQAGVQLMALSRAGASASLWPIALGGLTLGAPGWPLSETLGVGGLGVGQVAQAGIGLLLAGAVVSSDSLSRESPRWLGVLVGIGGMGVYNAIAVLSGGQIQQATVIFTILGSVWLALRCTSQTGQLLALALGGFVVSATYAEFLIASPLYVLPLAIAHRQHALTTAAQLGALFIGWFTEQIVTRGSSLMYLLDQSKGLPGWAPLPSTPASFWEVIVDVILQTRPPLLFLPAVALATGLFLLWSMTRDRPRAASTPVPLHVLALLLIVAAACSLVVARSPNLNYAAFKMSGWLGPGLLLIGWLLTEALAGRTRHVVRALLFALVLARVGALLYGGNEVLALGRENATLAWPRRLSPDGTCEVRVDASIVVRTFEGIAGSAAPFYDCRLFAD